MIFLRTVTVAIKNDIGIRRTEFVVTIRSVKCLQILSAITLGSSHRMTIMNFMNFYRLTAKIVVDDNNNKIRFYCSDDEKKEKKNNKISIIYNSIICKKKKKL